MVGAVLSGNRNFEGRVNPLMRANYLASPPLVVAYALAGSMKIDMTKDPLGTGKDGKPVYLKDIWPSNKEVPTLVDKSSPPGCSRSATPTSSRATRTGASIETEPARPMTGTTTRPTSSNPPYFEGMGKDPGPLSDIAGARLLAMFGDSITTDHISPAGSIKKDSPAGNYLGEHGVAAGLQPVRRAARQSRGDDARHLRQHPHQERDGAGHRGRLDQSLPDRRAEPIYDAAMRYKKEGVPLIVIAGKEYGTGTSRDWAAKGTNLLGVKAVMCESFERIHRSNLVGMGVLPLQFKDGMTRKTLNLTGDESFDISGIDGALKPGRTCRSPSTAATAPRDGHR